MPSLSKLSHFFSCWRNFSSSLLSFGPAQAEMIIAEIIRTDINAFFIINLNRFLGLPNFSCKGTYVIIGKKSPLSFPQKQESKSK
jgi:hypothetical protein